MRCKCGYSFIRERLESLRKDLPAEFKSYAVIDDKYYMIFLRREVAVLKCRDEANRMAALAESSQYCGCLMVCPQCSRLLLSTPGSDDVEFYKRDE